MDALFDSLDIVAYFWIAVALVAAVFAVLILFCSFAVCFAQQEMHDEQWDRMTKENEDEHADAGIG